MWPMLVDNIAQNKVLITEEIHRAFLVQARYLFVDQHNSFMRQLAAGADYALNIGNEQTISQPSIVARSTELLSPQKGETVLDVGIGSGWQAALLQECVGKEGCVYGIERIGELLERTRNRLSELNLDSIQLIHGDGTNPTDVPEGPFHIITSAAGCKEAPEFWKERLADGGRLLYPKQVADIRNGTTYYDDGREVDADDDEDGPVYQLCLTTRSGDTWDETFEGDTCRYVPLVTDSPED